MIDGEGLNQPGSSSNAEEHQNTEAAISNIYVTRYKNTITKRYVVESVVRPVTFSLFLLWGAIEIVLFSRSLPKRTKVSSKGRTSKKEVTSDPHHHHLLK